MALYFSSFVPVEMLSASLDGWVTDDGRSTDYIHIVLGLMITLIA